MEEKKKFRFPDSWVLLILLAAVFALLSYVIPAGEYTRVLDEATGRQIVDPESFHLIDSNPTSFFGFFKSIFTAFGNAASIMFFSFIISGAFMTIRRTGALDAGIGRVVTILKGREVIAIPILTIIFSIFGAVMGSAEEMLPFYPLAISMCVALGFDPIVGVAVVLCGAGAGFAGALSNPFTIGIAQGIAGLPLFSGIGYRAVTYVGMVGLTIAYIWIYARRVHKDPAKSLMSQAEIDYFKDNKDQTEIPEFTVRRKMVILLFILAVIWMGYGLVKLGFYFPEMAAVFIICGIACGLVGGLGANDIASAFVDGMKDMVYGAFVIGIAYTVSVVMSEAGLLDTFIHALASLVADITPVISAVLMFIVQTFINFFIPSGSGQAAVSMPIMAPLADIIGITRQTAVLAFQFGDGLSNLIFPTSGYMMAGIALGRIKWTTWAKFMWKLFLLMTALAAIFVAIAAAMNFGPF